jgi:chemotaxis protein MotB
LLGVQAIAFLAVDDDCPRLTRLRAESGLARHYGSYFASIAYSEFRPLSTGKTEAAYAQNRRIEISVVLRDAGIRSVIEEYMKNQTKP